MLPAEVMRQIRRLQLRARRAVQTLPGGEYHAVFKGTGLSFEEVREYQPGDDVRSIDWNVTARMGSTFIKRFVEERELTVLLAVDVSGSQRFGTQKHTKRAVAAEVAALIAFSAVANNDRVGLLAVSDEVERFIPPGKGTKHALRVLRDILFYEPRRPGPVLPAAGVPAGDRAMTVLAAVLLLGAAPPPAFVRLNTSDPANLIEARAQLDAGETRLSGEVQLTITVEGPGPLTVTPPKP